jgi:molecular chaperone DnaK
MAGDNMSLGRFRLDGIPPAPRGIPQIEVTFDIDANGILNVTAKDKATSKEQKITVTASTNLSKEDVARKVEEARRNEAEDKKRREIIEARNNADSLIYQTEKALRELGEKVPANDRSNIESKVSELKQALQGDDLNLIKKLSEELQNAFYALSQQMYAQGQQTPPSGGPQGFGGDQPGPGAGGPQTPPPPPESDGDVIDGDVREA